MCRGVIVFTWSAPAGMEPRGRCDACNGKYFCTEGGAGRVLAANGFGRGMIEWYRKCR
jgi:hypothetical protein